MRQFLIGVLTVGLFLSPVRAETPAAVDALGLYGPEMNFEIFRNGNTVGRHRVRFRRDGEDLLVEARTEIAIELLLIVVYRFDYRARERWRDDRLVALDARTDDDGEVSEVVARLDDEGLRLEGPEGAGRVPMGTYTTNHWNRGVVRSDLVINTITGLPKRVVLERIGRESVAMGNGVVEATHYAYRGDLDAEVWYDDRGRWVRLRFPGSDGSEIEYRCRICSAETSAERLEDPQAPQELATDEQ